MSTYKFEFGASYETIEIANKQYKVDFSDKSIRELQVKVIDFVEEYQRIEKIDTSELSIAEQKDYFDQASKVVKSFIDSILGEGSYDGLYIDSGKSLFNMLELVNFLSDIISQKVEGLQKSKHDKYVKPYAKSNKKNRK